MIVILKCTAKEILLKITPISGITLHFMELLTFANIHLQNVFDPNQTYLIGSQQRESRSLHTSGTWEVPKIPW